ncbi:MAG: S9 family peptidase [Bacteroidetes bacterium]|nr:S9 family peptidase [Bacteroidota bacterium]
MNRYFLITLLLSITFSSNAADRLTPELLWKLGRVGSPSVSPDGKTMVFGVRYYQLIDNSGNSDLYSMSINGGEKKQLTSFAGNEFSPQWRPDGEKIGFLSNENGSVQLWEMDPDGENKEMISNVEEDITNFSYSPKMTHIWYTKDVKLDNMVKDIYPDLPYADARIIDDLMYRHWDGWHDYAYSHIFIAEIKDGKISEDAMDIMEGETYDSPLNPFGGAEQISWNADGSGIAYTCKKMNGREWTVSTNSSIYFYDIASKKTTDLTKGMIGYDKEPAYSRDGKAMVWLSMATDGFEADRNRIFHIDIASGKKQELTVGFDQSCGNVVWSADSKKLYFTSGINATYQIYELDVATKKIRQVTEGIHNYRSVSYVNSKTLVGSRMSMSQAAENYSISIKNGSGKQLTFVNKKHYENIQMGKVEKRMVKTTDGKDMLVWVIFPPDFDPSKKYPALLYCQGGPQSAVSQFFSFRWNFQLMAANDYIIIAPNRRGLPSFGQEWNDQISGDWGGQAMKDYLSAIDEIKKEPYIDESRIGAVGASFGGYSVYWLAGNHEKRFKAFISHCGLFNLESWYATTEEMFFADWDVKGAYWDQPLPVSYKKHSPHRYVGNWDTPILVIHSERDFRVPIGEGIQAFNIAQLRGIESRFLYFPDEGHWIMKPQNGVLWHRVFFDWLNTYLK